MPRHRLCARQDTYGFLEYSTVVDHPLASSAPRPSRTFADLGVPAALVRVLARDGVVAPFPIQAATVPDALAGRDVLGRGATGSGKSYAFLLPIVARLSEAGRPARARRPRALVLAPTRELAAQLDQALAPLASAAGLRHTTVFGGVPARPQIQALQRGVDIVIACPGRLTDHLNAGRIDLGDIEITVLDEADHMADMGFLPDVRGILDRTPQGSQRLLFSATLDSGVDVLVKRYLDNPVVHRVDAPRADGRTVHRIVRVTSQTRLGTITELAGTPGRVVVFTRTKRGATKLARQLVVNGVAAVELHGNLTQNARRRNLAAFSSGSVETLVATDIAARGIHVDDIALVVHADPPADHKAYVHRSGRTARAGASGVVVTLASDDQFADVTRLTSRAAVKTDVVATSAPRPARAQRPRGKETSGRHTKKPRSHSAAGFSASRRAR